MSFLNYIYGSKCISCGKENCKLKGGLCETCLINMGVGLKKANNHFYFIDYKDEKNYFLYQGKENNKPHYIKKFSALCGELLINKLEKDAIITYVPLHKKTLAKRGFNQSEIIAKEISKKTNIKLVKLLKKVRLTKEQKHLNIKERKINLLNAFITTKNISKEKVIYIVDDIYTTGATLKECKLTLINEGVKKVIFITLARVPQFK